MRQLVLKKKVADLYKPRFRGNRRCQENLAGIVIEWIPWQSADHAEECDLSEMEYGRSRE